MHHMCACLQWACISLTEKVACVRHFEVGATMAALARQPSVLALTEDSQIASKKRLQNAEM